MDPLVQQEFPGGVDLGGQARGLGLEDVDTSFSVLEVVPASDVVLSRANWILEGGGA